MKKTLRFSPDQLVSYSDHGLDKDSGAWVLTGSDKEIRDVNHCAEWTKRLALAISILSVG